MEKVEVIKDYKQSDKVKIYILSSILLVGIMLFLFYGLNENNIHYNLTQLKPKGMTPITYSLKQAIKNDFIGFSGKKHIILLTDGGENCDESPCKFVMELIKVRKDIVIDVIAFNIDNPDDIGPNYVLLLVLAEQLQQLRDIFKEDEVRRLRDVKLPQ